MNVRPIAGKPFCFEVDSRSGGRPHVVDWLADPPSCSCNHYAYNARQHLATTGKPLVCSHMEQARDYEWADIISAVKEQIRI